MEMIEGETKVIERLYKFPSPFLMKTIEKLVEVDGLFVIQVTGEFTYEKETLVKAYNSDGEFLQYIPIKKEYIYKTETRNGYPYSSTRQIAYINNEFFPITTKGMTLEEINSSVRLIQDSFPVNDLTYEHTDNTLDRINEYNTNYSMAKYKKEDKVPMFALMGRHTRSIIQYVDAKVFDMEEYKENIVKAKNKYPDWTDDINRIVQWNKDSITLIKRIKTKLNKLK